MPDPSQTFATLKQAFEADTLARDDYWREASALHSATGDHGYIPPHGRLKTVTDHAGGPIIELDNGLTFAWRPEDPRQAASIVVNHGDYETGERHILETVARRSLSVFDIGANAGWFALHLSRVLPEGGSLSAFEPVPSTYAELTANITRNGLEGRIKAYHYGLSDQPGEAVMYLPDFSGSPAASLKNLHPDETNVEVRCQLNTLDGHVEKTGTERLDLIKCDVEGAELMALKGGRKALSRFQPVIFMEMLRKWSKRFGYHPNDIIDLLSAHGYRCWGLEESGLHQLQAVNEDTLATNYLFAIPDRHADILAELGIN